MMIPDLDEDEAEDLTLQVAAAPKTTARRLQSLEQVIIISTRNQDVVPFGRSRETPRREKKLPRIQSLSFSLVNLASPLAPRPRRLTLSWTTN
jgi:hypothetical protein